ncbi:MAG TPA: aldo/keto reductase [Salinimicrobium sp.]|nr:aldo/keto reductase [Salinimicrobium sp.]
MREKNSYSRFVQNVFGWTALEKGEMIQLLHHCVEHNITSFENADFQGKNHTTQKFGTALSESGLSRDEIQLISKYNSANKAGLMETVDQVLLHLDTDYLDLLLLDNSEKNPEIHDDIEQLFNQGKILELGALNMKISEMEDSDFIFHATQINLPISSFQDLKNIIPEIHPSEEIVNLLYCDLNRNFSRFEAAAEMCKKYDLNEDQILLMWLLKHPSHLHLVINYSEKEKISAATDIREKLFAPIDWEKLNLLIS